MSNINPKIRLAGVPVLVSYVADPTVGHGEFHLENHESLSVTASVESAWLRLGNDRRVLSGFSVYDIDRQCTLDPKQIGIAPDSVVRFYFSFPAVSWEPRFGQTSEVGMTVKVGSAELQATSEVQFERRIPRTG